ncbi:MAG: glycosyltransferase family 2 protein [Sphingobacteriales bacterium]|nr:glycosyltransferase family 2 protein [Sphingobacteriales bacterium]
MNNPLISICIPAYNAAPYIVETLSCFKNQSYNHLEIIVQDDCSTDATYVLAEEEAKKDKRIKAFKNSRNLGIGKNWNEAYSKANGDLIVIANADDIYHPDMLINALSIFNQYPQLDSVSFKFLLFNENLNTISELLLHKQLNVGLQTELFRTCFFYNPFHIVFSIFKKSSLDKILVDNQELFLKTQICDAELFFRIGKNSFRHYYSDYIAGKYRKHQTNNSYIPNGESYSWLYDVFPLYRNYLKENYLQETKALLKSKIVHQFKFSLRNFRRLDIKQISTLLKELNLLSKKT